MEAEPLAYYEYAGDDLYVQGYKSFVDNVEVNEDEFLLWLGVFFFQRDEGYR
jgi:hypothetical protein